MLGIRNTIAQVQLSSVRQEWTRKGIKTPPHNSAPSISLEFSGLLKCASRFLHCGYSKCFWSCSNCVGFGLVLNQHPQHTGCFLASEAFGTGSLLLTQSDFASLWESISLLVFLVCEQSGGFDHLNSNQDCHILGRTASGQHTAAKRVIMPWLLLSSLSLLSCHGQTPPQKRKLTTNQTLRTMAQLLTSALVKCWKSPWKDKLKILAAIGTANEHSAKIWFPFWNSERV